MRVASPATITLHNRDFRVTFKHARQRRKFSHLPAKLFEGDKKMQP